MKTKFVLAAAAAFALGAPSALVAQAPTYSAEQMVAWKFVSQSWADEVAENGKWPEAYLAEQFVSWEADWPSPRSRSSITKWTRFREKQSKTLEYEITPVAIALSGNTAVVHYTAVEFNQYKEEKPQREVIGIIETLVRDGKDWKFLSSTGFDLKK